MSNTNITPGTLYVDGYNTTAVIAETIQEGITQDWSSFQRVCVFDYGHADQEKHFELNKANAAEMVKRWNAFPELVEALQKIYDVVPKQNNDADWWSDQLASAMNKIESIIKKL